MPLPISDLWISTVDDEYDHAATVVLLTAPAPRDIDTSYAELAAGVGGADLPPWVGALVAGQLPAAMRDVMVTSGTGLLDLSMDPTVPTGSVQVWADHILPRAHPTD